MEQMYHNPVVRGFHPDPSVIRVGEDYYLATSTFQYFPGIAILHSRDLVNWKTIGHGFTDSASLDLSDIADSHGLWAPDLSYHDGKFILFAPLRLNNPPEGHTAPLRVQLVATAARPEGPYSTPVRIAVDNIDPSLFVDDDGKRYMIIPPAVRIVELSDDCTRALGEPVTVWAGTGRSCPEGPRVFKKDGWYYAMLAEGGTGYGHCITVARARSLFGPYEECPFNPVFNQPDPNAPIQRCGHGQLVSTPHGEWWMMYLCGRINEGSYTTLGRETALDPVRWTEDGWFVVNEGKGPSLCNAAPLLPPSPCEEDGFDGFETEKLSLAWQWVRNPDDSAWSLTQRAGYLRLLTGDHDLDTIAAKNTLLRREESFLYAAGTMLSFEPLDGEQAGLTCYYGTQNYIKLYCTAAADGGRLVRLEENRNGLVTTLGVCHPPKGEVYLGLHVKGQTRSFVCGTNEADARQVGIAEDCTFLSDEGVAAGKHHTGTLVGLFATNKGSGRRIAADFDWFSYKNL